MNIGSGIFRILPTAALLWLAGGTWQAEAVENEGGQSPLVWVAMRQAGTVVAVSPKTLQPVSEIVLPAGRAAHGLAAAPAALWVTDTSGHVYRIDPATRRIIAAGRASTHADQVTAAASAVWVSNGDQALISRIDPVSAAVTETVAVGWWVLDVAVEGDTLWVASDGSRGGQISRMPLMGAEIADRLELDWRPEALAVGLGSIWVHDAGFGAVHQLDAKSGSLRNSIALGAEMYEGLGIVTGDDAVWVALGMEEAIAHVDPVSGTVTRVAMPGFTLDVAAGGGAVWAVLPEDDLLVRIEPDTMQVSGRVRVPGYPVAVEIR